MPDSTNPFLLNVGFIAHQTVGYSREFPFDFLSAFLPPDTKLTNLTGNARVTRTTQGLLVQVQLKANIPLECGRCLSGFSQQLETDFTELYAFNTNSITESGYILPDNGKINLSPIIRDEMLLAIPINPVCKPDCKGLCPDCGEDLNETSCEHSVDKTNSWQDESESSSK